MATVVETSNCTLCAAVESPGFYTGCMIADGHSGNGWQCDGKGNLTRERGPCFCGVAGCPNDKGDLCDMQSQRA